MSSVATIYVLAGSRDLLVNLPGGGKWVRPWLKSVIGSRCSMKWFKDAYTGLTWWRVKKTHLVSLQEALRERYSGVWVITQYGTGEACTSQCQGAKADQDYQCECVCGGTYHGAPSGNFKNVVGDLLISTEIRQITRFYRGKEK